MLNHALIYLESKGLFYADPAYYSPNNSVLGIILDIESIESDDSISISVSPSPTESQDSTPKITLNIDQEDLLESILDVLIFAIDIRSKV
jgi:hypothetical protein